jgi:hypothetical protein
MSLNAHRHGAKARYRFADRPGVKFQLQIITTKEIPGKFISQKCATKGCDNQIGYWSKTGKAKPEYRDARCAKHGGRV